MGAGGTLNLAGAFQVNLTTAVGTLTGGTGTFNYDGTSAQTVPVGAVAPNVVYNNLHTNNTSATGATLGGPPSSASILTSLRVQSGTLNNGNNGITGAAGDTFEVANGATFRLTGSSTTPTGPAGYTKTFGDTSTTDYAGATQAIGPESYGHLSLNGTGTKSAPNPVTVRGDWTLNTGTTFAGSPAAVTFAGAAANQHIGGTQPTSFVALTVNKNAGTTVTLDDDTTVTGLLNLANGTITTGSRTLIVNNGVIRNNGFVNGNMRKPAVAATTTLTFEVGTGTSDYSPVTLNFTGASGTGTVTGEPLPSSIRTSRRRASTRARA